MRLSWCLGWSKSSCDANHVVGFFHVAVGPAQWLSGRVLDSRSRGWGFKPHRRHCVVSLSKTLYPLLRTGSTQEDRSQHDWKIEQSKIMPWIVLIAGMKMPNTFSLWKISLVKFLTEESILTGKMEICKLNIEYSWLKTNCNLILKICLTLSLLVATSFGNSLDFYCITCV